MTDREKRIFDQGVIWWLWVDSNHRHRHYEGIQVEIACLFSTSYARRSHAFVTGRATNGHTRTALRHILVTVPLLDNNPIDLLYATHRRQRPVVPILVFGTKPNTRHV